MSVVKSDSPHPCSGKTASSDPCKINAPLRLVGGHPDTWYCSVHIKKLRAEAEAEAAFKNAEKKAKAKAKAKANAGDPNYHLCVAIAHGTLARCQCRGTNQVAATEDWMCTAHYREALAKAERPKASQAEDRALMNQQCCGNKKGDCQHQVKYIVDDHFFCHLHNRTKW